MEPNKLQEWLTWFNLIGLPSIFLIGSWCFRQTIKFGKSLKILMDAQQKQMRRDLMNDYHKYMQDGYISDEDLETWESGYQAYHALGMNGIMDNRRQDLMDLPSSEEKIK